MFFIHFLDRCRNLLKRTIVTGIVLTLIIQLMYGFGLNSAKFTHSPLQSVVTAEGTVSSDVNFELADANLQTQRVTLSVNGVTKGSFTANSMQVQLHQGDVVAIETSGVSESIHVVVDHDDPKLFYPAPGFTVVVDDQHPYTFQKVEFVQP